MRSKLLLLFTLLSIVSFGQATINYPVTTTAVKPFVQGPQKMLVINANTDGGPGRKNRAELNKALSDSITLLISREIAQRIQIPAIPVTAIPQTASERKLLLEQNHASHLIVLVQYDGYFEQREVEVTKTKDGKSREAFYDIANTASYQIYDANGLYDTKHVNLRKEHSSRQVMSGLLAAGPSYNHNRKDFYNLAEENARNFLNHYFTGYIIKERMLFSKGAFREVGKALKQNDYDRAWQHSEQLSKSSKKHIAAEALYNLAVLSERKNNPTAAKYFMTEAVALNRAFSLLDADHSLRGVR